jgi:hypothetical protein
VSGGRRERVAPPPVDAEWDLKFGKSDVKRGWDELCRTARANARRAFEALRAEPCPMPETIRQHRLKGSFRSTTFDGQSYALWQYEVTSGGRIWYCVDEGKRIVWLLHAGPGHPRVTE